MEYLDMKSVSVKPDHDVSLTLPFWPKLTKPNRGQPESIVIYKGFWKALTNDDILQTGVSEVILEGKDKQHILL